MITYPNDTNRYQHLTLSNGLRVLLVNNHQSNKSAACIAIKAGHFDDPKELPGLAHLLEHMLFLGTAAYPVAGEMNDFLTKHGGNINAWTGTEISNYYFDAQNDHFEPSLARFADMFSHALFDEKLVAKEKLAIDAEFKLKQQDDLRRLYQVHKETCNPKHPFSKFSVGNLETLGKISERELSESLKRFYKNYYTAVNSRLVIVSHLEFEQQRSILERYFSALSDKQDHRQVIAEPLYTSEQLGVFINVEPLNKASRLILSFALPAQNDFYQHKPALYISNLLGYEGKGSLLSYLKSKGWVNKLSAGGGISGSNFKDFNVNLQLTEAGINNVDHIIAAVFSYIALIKLEGVERWRFEEKKQLSEIAFNSIETKSASDTANLLAGNMHYYPPEQTIAGDFQLAEFNPELIKQMLSLLNPANMRVKKIWQGLKTNRVANYYNTRYSINKISTEQISSWCSPATITELRLPEKNSFICSRFEPLPLEQQIASPKKIKDGNDFVAWHLQEPEFRSAKGSIHLSLDNSQLSNTAQHAVLRKLLTALLRDSVNELYYHAEVSGLSYDIYSTQGGLTLRTAGFSENQWMLLEQLLNCLLKQNFSEARFEQIKQQLQRSYKNSRHAKPLNQLFTHITNTFQSRNFSAAELAASIAPIQFSDVENFQQQFTKNIYCELFAHGDWPQSLAEEKVEQLNTLLGKANLGGNEQDRTPSNINYSGPWYKPFNCHHHDAALICYYQGKDASAQENATFMLMEQLISSTFFHQLRTEQQLGYVVGVGYSPINLLPGLAAYIQAPKHSVNEIYAAIIGFFGELPEQLESLPEEHFRHVANSVIHQLSQPDANLAGKNQRLWMAIANKDYQFNYQQRLIEYLETISKQQFIDFATAFFAKKENLMVTFSEGELGQATFC